MVLLLLLSMFLPKEMSSTWYKVKEFTEKEEERK
jgi:hypothetical protein